MRPPADDAVELLRELVRVPSVNPSGEAGTSEVGEAHCAGFIAERLTDCGAEAVELREVLPGRPNVLGRFPADRPGKPRLLLCPHTDTVSVAGMTVDPFAAERRDGRIYGRGACDTKGTIAAMLWALWELRESLPFLQHEVWFAGLMDEEAGNAGAHALAAEFAGADFALVGEPTGCQIVHTHKGVTWLQLTAPGRAAHSAAPERGENAIYKMADVLRCIRDELAPELASRADPVLGAPTVNAGLIRGGSKVNIVPETCSVELDLRTVPAQRGADFVKEIGARLRRACPELRVVLFRGHQPLYTSPEHPCVRALEAAGGKCVGAPWFCDGSVLAEVGGIPAVAAGPGSIAQAHTADEWLSEADLREGVEFYKRFLTTV
jgi:acetylornithine deacetylase/succinyl-diaminopimelate desuccinylase-like protein